MKGLYLVLENLEKETKRWTRPFSLLENEEIGTLIVASPRKPLSPREKKALDFWFSKGGHMMLLHDGDWEIKASGYNQETQSFKETFKEQSQLSTIKDRLNLTNFSLKNNPEGGVAIIQQIFSHPGPVYFDEYHLNNGETKSPWMLIKQYCSHPIGWVTLHIIIVFLIYLLNTPNVRKVEEEAKKEEVNLIQARASFLKLTQAEEFANHVISKYRRNKNERSH